MARHTFGGGSSDWAFTWNGDGSIAQAPGTVLTFWDSLTGGTQYQAASMPGGVDDGTGLLDGTGTPTSSVTCDSNGEIPDALQGPADVYRMAADGSADGSGPRRWIYANDIGDVLTTLAGDVAPLAAMQLAPYVYYDPATASYPARPDPATYPIVWAVGPVAPTLGGAGGFLPTDIWLDTTSGVAPGGVTSVTAADASIAVDNTNPDTPTIATGRLDQIATQHPPTATVPMNSQTLSNLADGVNPQDAATVSQLPSGGVTLDSTATDIAASPGTQAAGSIGKAADAGHVHPAPAVFAPAGLPGAVTASRYVGATASGAPATGTFAVGDFVITAAGNIWVCTAAGTPGTWVKIAQLDTAAAGIQAAGTQAAGSTGKAADAGHVHPWVQIPTGVKTAAYTAAAYDLVRVSTAGGAVTITLPSAPADRTIIGVKVVTTGSPCTVAASGADTFTTGTGATTYVLNRAETVIFQYVAANKVWLSLAHNQAIPFPAAAVNFKPANPASTASTTLVMMGLGAASGGQACVYTPAGTGKVRVTVTGAYLTLSAAVNVTLGGRWGTGTPPANGAAVTGTRWGGAADQLLKQSSASAGAGIPFTLDDIITGLTPGTPVWVDVALDTATAGDQAELQNLSVTFQELIS